MESFVIAGGISVHMWDTKDETPSSVEKPVLMLLHGYLETMYVFNELIEELKENFRIITLDLPGHGLTDSAPADSKGAIVNSVEFDVPVICDVLDKCGVGKAILAGHSMGGYITLECLRERPERFEKAILLSSHPYPDAPDVASNRQREIKVIEAEKLELLASASIPKMYYEENLRRCDEKIRETVELCETHNPQGIIASVRGIASRPNLEGVMQHPPVPLMLIHGDHDNYLPFERVEQMKSNYKEVTYRLIPSTGHNAFIENQQETVKAILDFTKGNC